jgi:hypothetical protein
MGLTHISNENWRFQSQNPESKHCHLEDVGSGHVGEEDFGVRITQDISDMRNGSSAIVPQVSVCLHNIVYLTNLIDNSC